MLCPKGHYCKSYEYYEKLASDASDLTAVPPVIVDIEYVRSPCEPGTYNDQEASTGPDACIPCIATKACERKAVTGPSEMVDCAAGYYCKSGASS